MTSLRLTIMLGLVLACGYPVARALAAEAAGNVVFASGEVQAVDAAGHARYLIKGDLLFAGDTVRTAAGKVQIRFSDGGYASLKADTEYRLADYVYRGAANGSERGFFNLLKGTVRFVTGAIGKVNRERFRIETKTATIGIRGSAGLAVSCIAGSCAGKPDGTYLTTYAGILTITAGSFSADVHPQETYFCDGANCRQIDEQRVEMPAAPLVPQLEEGYRQGDQQRIDPGGHSHDHITPDGGGSSY